MRVTGYEKRIDRENGKFYVYVIEVERNDGRTDVAFRRFRYSGMHTQFSSQREFQELHDSLTELKVDLPVFPSKIYVGRSHTKQVQIRLIDH